MSRSKALMMSDRSVIFRIATMADADEISEMITLLARAFVTPDFDETGAAHLVSKMSPEAVRGYLASNYRFHVAENRDRIVGVIAIRDNKHLFWLFVEKSLHRQGIGKRLWQVAQEVSIQSGNAGEFTVNAARRSVPFYERLGFVATANSETKHGVTYFPMQLEINDGTV